MWNWMASTLADLASPNRALVGEGDMNVNAA